MKKFLISLFPLKAVETDDIIKIKDRDTYLKLILMHAGVGVYSFLFLQTVTVIGQILYMAMLFSMK